MTARIASGISRAWSLPFFYLASFQWLPPSSDRTTKRVVLYLLIDSFQVVNIVLFYNSNLEAYGLVNCLHIGITMDGYRTSCFAIRHACAFVLKTGQLQPSETTKPIINIMLRHENYLENGTHHENDWNYGIVLLASIFRAVFQQKGNYISCTFTPSLNVVTYFELYKDWLFQYCDIFHNFYTFSAFS